MDSSREEFISREISVTRDQNTGRPVSFRWDGRLYAVTEVIAIWPDWGFPAGSPRRKTWRMRRHRNCYRVETDCGEIFELYHDRGIKGESDTWILRARIK